MHPAHREGRPGHTQRRVGDLALVSWDDLDQATWPTQLASATEAGSLGHERLTSLPYRDDFRLRKFELTAHRIAAANQNVGQLLLLQFRILLECRVELLASRYILVSEGRQDV